MKSNYAQAVEAIQAGLGRYLKDHRFLVRGRTFNRSTEDGLTQAVGVQMGALKVAIKIGRFESPPGESFSFRPMPPTFTTYDEWKKGCLRRRTDNMVGLSEKDVKPVVAGPTGK